MKKQPPTESAETENALAGVAVDKALIKQFARRIYDRSRACDASERHEA